jgi:pilus assembly protein CpaB
MREVEIPLGLAPRGALTQISEGVGRMTKQDIVGGEMVMSQHLADPTNIHRDLAFILEDNEVLMAFPVVDLMGQLEMLARGDRVDIFITISQEVQQPEEGAVTFETPEPETKEFTLDAMQRIEITATIVEITSASQGGQAQQVHLRDTGAIFDFVLRSPTSNLVFDLEPVTSEYLIDLFGLEGPQE